MFTLFAVVGIVATCGAIVWGGIVLVDGVDWWVRKIAWQEAQAVAQFNDKFMVEQVQRQINLALYNHREKEHATDD